MNKFLPVLLALAFSALAVGLTMFVVRPRVESIRGAADGLRHKLEEAIEEKAEPEGVR